MIPFDEIDKRLEALGRNRSWLAQESSRSPSSIRSALAPNAPEKQRSSLLQKALSDAILREEERQRPVRVVAAPSMHLPDRITVECQPEERRAWEQAALASKPPATLEQWAVAELNAAAEAWHQGQSPAPHLSPVEPSEHAPQQKQA